MTIMQGVVLIINIYMVMFFIKFCLMLGTIGVAAGVSQRLFERQGYIVSYQNCLEIKMYQVIWFSFSRWPLALRVEKFKFFRAYTKYETMKDMLQAEKYRLQCEQEASEV